MPVAVSITDTLSLPLLRHVDPGAGRVHRHTVRTVPTAMVAVTVLVVVSMTETSSLKQFPSHTAGCGGSAHRLGEHPRGNGVPHRVGGHVQ